ncbi:hypothetical protein [Pontixanthobacter aquaemixtae]|uniref:Uncharacterized protein n=1 Tax=Pontixanthobacter aquaemixtae TaxID=1958940 RepID=A0A844ZRK3_9SPHN|nr:hypothetical protein [Pontixanthobacter aquaemixtae]MXO90951.1 hypothetical protein [Pontixanthobacter aquaemixtae]
MALPATAQTRDGWSADRHTVAARNQRYYKQAYTNPGIERRIDSLSQEIRQARRAGILTRQQAQNIRTQLNAAERSYRALARNGLSRQDIRNTNQQLARVQVRLDNRRYAHNRGDRRGNGRYARNVY